MESAWKNHKDPSTSTPILPGFPRQNLFPAKGVAPPRRCHAEEHKEQTPSPVEFTTGDRSINLTSTLRNCNTKEDKK